MISKKIEKNNEISGFTLVELLAVIVILAIILVIAVPKIMSVIEDAKKATLESTAKMIASQAEKQKVQNTVLGNDEAITCKDITNINDIDYASCDITFDNNTAKVTIEGSGKFEGLYVCSGTKTNATSIQEECPIEYGDADVYISRLLAKENELKNGLVQTTVEYNGKDYNAGIRYIGDINEVKNKVYYNCENIDINGVNYGGENYDYASSCEVWRIVGVFDTKTSNDTTAMARVKLVNIESRFTASWDSSGNTINNGYGVNQWGESTYDDGSVYEGADLMNLLNGYYIGKPDSDCKFCNNYSQAECSQTCTADSLKDVNMKLLTEVAKKLIEKVVWDTYAVHDDLTMITSSNASTAYLQEKGISTQYTGRICQTDVFCNDKVIRTINWTGLVGLMSVADMGYAGGWSSLPSDVTAFPWLITPGAKSVSSTLGWADFVGIAGSSPVHYSQSYVFPSVYLKSNIKIIDGNGVDEPYKLAL